MSKLALGLAAGAIVLLVFSETSRAGVGFNINLGRSASRSRAGRGWMHAGSPRARMSYSGRHYGRDFHRSRSYDDWSVQSLRHEDWSRRSLRQGDWTRRSMRHGGRAVRGRNVQFVRPLSTRRAAVLRPGPYRPTSSGLVIQIIISR